MTSKKYNQLKIALVYDQLVKWGGAERLIFHLLKILPTQTVIFSPKVKREIINNLSQQIKTSYLSFFPFSLLPYQLHFNLSQIVIENFDFHDFDLVFTLGLTLSKGILTKPPTKHLHYAFSTNRFLWQDYHLFKKSLPLPLKYIFANWTHKHRSWDYIASQRPDKILTLSNYSKRLISKYYHRPAEVLYPPFDLDYWLNLKAQGIELPFNKFFLIISRLVPQKRVETIIKIANKNDFNLVVVGQGWLASKLKRMAGKRTTFFKKLTDQQLKYLYEKTIALLAPQEEDFGYVFLEAASFFTPIVYYHRGGQTEILKNYPLGKSYQNNNQLDQLLTTLYQAPPRSRSNWPSQEKMTNFFKPFKINRFAVKLKKEINQLIMKG